jgi:hypothetical protein
MIAEVGRMVMRDMAVSSDLDDQRARTGLGNLLLRALPLSQLDAGPLQKPGLAAEFLPYVGGFDEYTAALRTTSKVGNQQKAHVVAVVQASGSGKTRLTYADGQAERLVVLARVQKRKGALTPAWEDFMQLCKHWESVLPCLDEMERRLVSLSALAAMRLLAACHVMHVARVLRCVASSPPASVTDATAATQREAALRACAMGAAILQLQPFIGHSSRFWRCRRSFPCKRVRRAPPLEAEPRARWKWPPWTLRLWTRFAHVPMRPCGTSCGLARKWCCGGTKRTRC